MTRCRRAATLPPPSFRHQNVHMVADCLDKRATLRIAIGATRFRDTVTARQRRLELLAMSGPGCV